MAEERTPLKILLVGAGATGQVFGLHLQRGGAEVAFLVKPRYADEARAGFTLYDLGAGGRAEPVRFEGFEVLTSHEEVAARDWDAVMLCVSTTALRAGRMVEELAEATGQATLIGLQPGLGDADFVKERAGADRVVWGIIELIAYQGPLEGETLPEPGVAFWIPWWLPLPFSGPEGRARQAVDALRAGGLRARVVTDVIALTAVGSPVLNLHMVALEAAGWSLSGVRADRALLALTGEAVREASAIAAHREGTTVPLWIRLVRPWQVRLLSWVAPRLAPLPIETYLRFHFTKVGDQTRHAVANWIEQGQQAGLSTGALQALRDRLQADAAPEAVRRP